MKDIPEQHRENHGRTELHLNEEKPEPRPVGPLTIGRIRFAADGSPMPGNRNVREFLNEWAAKAEQAQKDDSNTPRP